MPVEYSSHQWIFCMIRSSSFREQLKEKKEDWQLKGNTCALMKMTRDPFLITLIDPAIQSELLTKRWLIERRALSLGVSLVQTLHTCQKTEWLINIELTITKQTKFYSVKHILDHQHSKQHSVLNANMNRRTMAPRDNCNCSLDCDNFDDFRRLSNDQIGPCYCRRVRCGCYFDLLINIFQDDYSGALSCNKWAISSLKSTTMTRMKRAFFQDQSKWMLLLRDEKQDE